MDIWQLMKFTLLRKYKSRFCNSSLEVRSSSESPLSFCKYFKYCIIIIVIVIIIIHIKQHLLNYICGSYLMNTKVT